MSLSGKLLILVLLFLVVNAAATAFLVEASYLGGGEFTGEADADLLAPCFWPVVGGGALCLAASGLVLYWCVLRMTLTPLGGIAAEAERAKAGETVVMRAASRRDEIGRLAASFNRLAGEVAEMRGRADGMVAEAVAESEKVYREFALVERLTATGRFAANVAGRLHADLETLGEGLAGLKGNALPPDERAACLFRCEESVKRLRNMSHKLFDMARKRADIGAVSVGDILAQSLDLVRHLLARPRISLVEEIDGRERGGGRLRTIADGDDLRYVFVNLLANAVDAMPRGGTLTVRASRVLKWITVEIIDTGGGLTIDEVSSSFEYFYSTKSGGKDVGLGLSIARHIMINYGGALTLNSRKGEGTKATVELPSAGESGRL